MTIFPRRLNLQKPNNVRELGGYMRKDGKITKYKEFLRSDMISGLPQEDIDYLVKYGVKTVIDLRADGECEKYPSSFADFEGIQYYNIPLLAETHPNIGEEFTIGDLYYSMLQTSKNIGALFNCIAENSEGVLLFNCTVGKDRTGVTAAIIFMLAGIDRSDIVADYQTSYTYVKTFFDGLRETMPEIPMHFVASNAEYMERFIDTINDEYDGIDNLLLSKGVSEKNIEIIRQKIIG